MKTTWQQAIEIERKQSVLMRVEVINQEYLDDENATTGGAIELCTDGKHYDVRNTRTRKGREELSAEEVEQALTDLNITNSGWC